MNERRNEVNDARIGKRWRRISRHFLPRISQGRVADGRVGPCNRAVDPEAIVETNGVSSVSRQRNSETKRIRLFFCIVTFRRFIARPTPSSTFQNPFESLQSIRIKRYTISSQHFPLLEKTLQNVKRVCETRDVALRILITGCRYNQILEIEAGYIEMLLEIDALFSHNVTSMSLSISCSNGTFLPNYRGHYSESLQNNFVVTSLIRSRYQSVDRLCG